MNMYRFITYGGHGVAELSEVLFSRLIKFHRNVDIAQSETVETSGFIGQGLFMRMQPKIDNVPYAELL